MSDDLRRVRDELEIGRLLARIAHLADDGDPEDYITCFTPDAVWDLADASDLPLDVQRIQGHEALLAGVLERRAARVQGPGSHTRHDISTSVVEIDGDAASARTYFRYYRDTDGIPALVAIGCYDDRLLRTAEGWRLHHRRISRN
ncbi:nuclear transport factor 2 family protein [Microbacterium sp. NIBRBAC000506063]|uniref:nuclear transport factor 2 family protein n=1 Tax=Microbacterium sp. NIBRBAC000506063 TaxID=2734618 RepID=UPI001BB53CA6|nr:nuclear transport factor 2 family protein [Microbacterium sp. NIBRBAC000506063]QTV79056.1 nuclear transport factor 2 family protein [Microbacterium sp. NIBRBAC000506063]